MAEGFAAVICLWNPGAAKRAIASGEKGGAGVCVMVMTNIDGYFDVGYMRT